MNPKKAKQSKRTTGSSSRRKSITHYSKAPLTEAVLDIRVEVPSEITLHELKNVQVGEEERYPRREDSIIVVGQVSMGTQVGASAKQTPNGYRFVSQDHRQIFQARLDSFTYNRLAPYETWESFRDEARRLWDIYRPIAKPKNIKRLALRYQQVRSPPSP